MGKKPSGREVQTIDDARYDIRCLDAWKLRMKGLIREEICRKLNVTHATLSRYLRRAAEIVRDHRAEEEKGDYDQACARSDYIIAKLTDRIEESLRPTLDLRSIADDIEKGAVKAFLFDPYLDDGIVNSVALAKDMASGVKLGPLRKYIIEGRLDAQAMKLLREAVESDRKLKGLDRNKHRLELSAAEGSAAEVAKDAIDQIAQIAKRRAAIREIEVKGKDVTGA